MIDNKPIKFDFNNREELNHRFQGNIIGLVDKENNQVIPFRLIRARTSGMEGELYSPDSGRYAADIYHKKPKDFNWNYPELGYVNIDNVAVFLSRNSGRYYTRGYDKRYVTSTYSFRDELRTLGTPKRYSDSGGGKLMYALFNREFDDFHAVLNSIEDGAYLARAFHKDWCIGVKRFSSAPVIYYKNNIVGYYTGGKAKLLPQSKFLKESLSVHTSVEIVDNLEEIYV